MPAPSKHPEAETLFRRNGGILRTSRAIALGVHPRALYTLRDSGRLVRLSRGLYRLAAQGPLGDPDLVTVALRVPQAVVCLVSALHHHGITTQIPHAVDIALPRGSKPPRLDFPPLRAHQFAREAFLAGVETHRVDGVPVRVFGPEKTVADCFKFRNRIGLDVAIEALRLCRIRKRSRPAELLRFARVCRVEKVLRPYLEAMV